MASMVAFLTASATLWSLGVAGIAGWIASIIERRFHKPRLSEWLVRLFFWIGIAGAQWLLTKLPHVFDLNLFLPNQLWERLLWPTFGIVLIASLVRSTSQANPTFEMLTAFSLTTIGMLFALPFDPNWSEFVPDNAYWLAAVALAVGWNVWAMESMAKRGAERWLFGIVTAQFGTIAAILLSAYATLGNWSVCLMLMCGVLAVIRCIQSNGIWIRAIFLPAIFIACSLVPMIRFYTSQSLGWGWYGGLLFFPTILGVIDRLIGERLGPRSRVAVSIASAGFLAVAAIARVWGSTEAH